MKHLSACVLNNPIVRLANLHFNMDIFDEKGLSVIDFEEVIHQAVMGERKY